MEPATQVLLDYSVLGVMCVLFVAAIGYLYRSGQNERSRMQARHEETVEKWHSIYREERKSMMKDIRDLAEAIRELKVFLQSQKCKYDTDQKP